LKSNQTKTDYDTLLEQAHISIAAFQTNPNTIIKPNLVREAISFLVTVFIAIIAMVLGQGVYFQAHDKEISTGLQDILEKFPHSAPPPSKGDKHGMSPAYIAAQKGNANAIAELAKNKMDLNQANKKGFTPAYIAATRGHADVIAELAKHGVDLNQRAPNGKTLTDIAKEKGHKDVVAELEKHSTSYIERFKKLLDPSAGKPSDNEKPGSP
jgi:hypothetical protein